MKLLPDTPRKGRGAVSNRTNRYERYTEHRVDDGWLIGDDPPPLRTTLIRDASKTIIARNSSPDVPFDRSINPYRGCEHGCIYCFARPTHAFLGLSPGLDFESQIIYKADAAMLLKKELGRPNYECSVLAMGTNTDPYQPAEKSLRLTRSILEVLSEFNHPVAIVTIPTGIMAAPMIPALNDQELEELHTVGRKAGAQFASYILLRLPLEIKDLFTDWLKTHFPQKAQHVMNLIHSTRSGKAYDSTFGSRMTGTGQYAALLEKRFEVASRRLGYEQVERLELNTNKFMPPLARDGQLALF